MNNSWFVKNYKLRKVSNAKQVFGILKTNKLLHIKGGDGANGASTIKDKDID